MTHHLGYCRQDEAFVGERPPPQRIVVERGRHRLDHRVDLVGACLADLHPATIDSAATANEGAHHMPGPIDTTRFVHNAIVAEADEIEAATKGTADATELAALADRIEWFGYVVNKHTTGEEVGLFPPLAERRPSIADTYLFDHVDERALFPELTQIARDASTGSGRARTAAAPEHRALRAPARARAQGERAHLPARQRALLPARAGRDGRQDDRRPDARGQRDRDAVDRPHERRRRAAGYVGALTHVMPPPAFEMAKGWIRDGVSAERWTELTQRVPALG